MTVYRWWVSFEDPGADVEVRATCEDEAKILAQAARIKQGMGWRSVRTVECVGVSDPSRRKHHNSLA